MSQNRCQRFTDLVLVGFVIVGGCACACSSSTPPRQVPDAGPTSDATLAANVSDVASVPKDSADVRRLLDAVAAVKDSPAADTPTATDSLLVDLRLGSDATDAPVSADAASDAADAPVSADAASDAPLRDDSASVMRPCATDAVGPICNDDLISAAIMGYCQADGTCVCKPGYAMNPATGRCRYTTRDAGTAADTVTVLTCSGEYTACGCGCCGGATAEMSCYFPTLGESTADLRSKDEAAKSSTNCDVVGCRAGVRHLCCAPAKPEAPGTASYRADWYPGGLDHLFIDKSGVDCATVYFHRPVPSNNDFLHIDVPAGWGTGFARVDTCGDAGLGESVNGAIGSLALHTSGNVCMADLHVTLFTFTSTGQVKTTRLDVDDLVIRGVWVGMCF